MQIAKTHRLTLSKITVEDAPFILELMNTPGWLKYIGDRNIKTVEAAAEHIKNNQLKCYAKFGFGYYKMQVIAENLKTIGYLRITKTR